MNEKRYQPKTPERLTRFLRDVNALGALAIGGVALAIPGNQPVLAAWAGINAVQAGGFEVLRRKATKKQPRER